jgi:hypothetical protein
LRHHQIARGSFATSPSELRTHLVGQAEVTGDCLDLVLYLATRSPCPCRGAPRSCASDEKIAEIVFTLPLTRIRE